MNRQLLAIAVGLAGSSLVGCAASGPAKPTLTKYTPPAGVDSYVRGVNAKDQGNNELAIQELERALQLNPNLRMAQSALGQLYMDRKDYDRAVPHLQAASDLDPYTVENHYNLGLTFQILNRLQEAAMAYLRGLKLAPDDFKTNVNLGLVYFAMAQHDPAIYYLEKATRIEPQNVRAWSNIGVVYDARGNLVLAEASYRKALELDPNNETTLINLTANLMQQKRGPEAVVFGKQLAGINPTPANLKRLGDAQTVASQWTDAERTYRSCLNTTNAAGERVGYLPALNGLAEMYIAHYEADLRFDDTLRKWAVTVWQQSLKLQPDQPAVTEALARYSDAKVFK